MPLEYMFQDNSCSLFQHNGCILANISLGLSPNVERNYVCMHLRNYKGFTLNAVLLGMLPFLMLQKHMIESIDISIKETRIKRCTEIYFKSTQQ